MQQNKLIYSVDDFARTFDLKPETIAEKCNKGQLPGRKAGRKWVFYQADLMKWIEALPCPGCVAA